MEMVVTTRKLTNKKRNILFAMAMCLYLWSLYIVSILCFVVSEISERLEAESLGTGKMRTADRQPFIAVLVGRMPVALGYPEALAAFGAHPWLQQSQAGPSPRKSRLCRQPGASQR